MGPNALLTAPRTTDAHGNSGYHQGMDGRSQLQHAPHWQPPHPPHPTGNNNRRWIPATLISAGIIIAGAIVGGALMSNNRTDSNAGGTGGVATSPTCMAWKTTRTAINAVPGLPIGWNWDTPNIDVYINNQATAVEKALTMFEPQIAAEPANVATAAHAYIDARRTEYAALRDRSYKNSDGVPVNIALGQLNQLCGITQ